MSFNRFLVVAVFVSILSLYALNLEQLNGIQLSDASIRPLKQGKCICELAVHGEKASWDQALTKNYYNYLDISSSASLHGFSCLLVKPGAAMKGKNHDTAW